MSIASRLSLLGLGLLVFATPSFAMSPQGCGGADCASCHTLSLTEAGGLLKDVGVVKEVKPAPVRGLYQVTLERDGKTAVAYLDYGKKHLIAGQIYQIAAPAEQKLKAKVPVASIPTRNALVMGNPKGKKRLFVFTDPECPFCAKMHQELKKLVKLEPDLAIYIEMFPLKIHPNSYDKARVILGRKSLALLEKSYAGGKLPAPGAQDSETPVDYSISFAASIGISATPTIVLPDGRTLAGARSAEEMRRLL
jgi:thiol:disulfide interchange protein DsbC